MMYIWGHEIMDMACKCIYTHVQCFFILRYCNQVNSLSGFKVFVSMYALLTCID